MQPLGPWEAESLCLPATVSVIFVNQEARRPSSALLEVGAVERWCSRLSQAQVERLSSLLSADAIGFDLVGGFKDHFFFGVSRVIGVLPSTLDWDFP